MLKTFFILIKNIYDGNYCSFLMVIGGIVSSGAILSEEELAAMSPTAAAVAKVVKPGMKLTEVSEKKLFNFNALEMPTDIH